MPESSSPLPQTEDLFRRQMAQFFEATTDAIMFLDRAYTITFLNRRAHELLSPGGDSIGRNISDRELCRVAAITSQTLRFHKQASSPQEITAAQLFESVLSVQHGRTVNSRVKITERLRDTRPVRCFEGGIRQVVSNLVTNALDAMHATGGQLSLRSRERSIWSTGEKGIVLTIADSGSGMSAETLGKLFNPLFTTKGTTGTGLGLWISKEIIDRHRGALRVRSSQKAPHAGTVFLPFDAVMR